MSVGPNPNPDRDLSMRDYAVLAELRYQLRRFTAFSEAEASRAGLPPQQHQALLVIAGHQSAEPLSVGVLTARLLIAPHTAAELVARMIDAGLVTKSVSPRDRRRIELALTPRATAVLAQLTSVHLEELRTLEPTLSRVLDDLRSVEDTAE